MPTASAPSVRNARISAGRLEARAGGGEVDALGERRCRARRRPRAGRRAARGRRRRAGSGSAGRRRRRSGPVSGLKPSMLMWSEIAIRPPGPTSARSEPAALVSRSVSAPSAFSVRTGVAHRARVVALVDVLAALRSTATGEPVERAERRARRRGRRRRAAGSRGARRRGCGRASSSASTSAPSPEPSTIPSRGVKPGARLDRGGGLGARLIRGTPGRTSAAAARRASSCGGRRSRSARWIGASGTMNSRSRWRQPPHGTHSSPLGAITATSVMRSPPAGDQRADRRRLRALALRVGGVLDVGADVDRAVLGAQRGADREVRVRRVGARRHLARAASTSADRSRRTWSE